LILDASLRLFSQKGFARTSVRDIAQAAGITDAAIYYHFASKRALFEALFEERGITPAIAELEQASVTNPPLESFTNIALTALDIMQRNRDFLRVLFTGALGQDRVAMEEYRAVVTRWANAQARIIRDFIAEDQLRPVDVDTAARQLVLLVITAFVDHVMSTRGTSRGDSPPPALVQQVELGVDNLVRGLRP
jgi:AcrR family transcriptional regulator